MAVGAGVNGKLMHQELNEVVNKAIESSNENDDSESENS